MKKIENMKNKIIPKAKEAWQEAKTHFLFMLKDERGAFGWEFPLRKGNKDFSKNQLCIGHFVIRIPIFEAYTGLQFEACIKKNFRNPAIVKMKNVIRAVNLDYGSDSYIEWNTKKNEIILHRTESLPFENSRIKNIEKRMAIELANMLGLVGIADKIRKDIIKMK